MHKCTNCGCEFESNFCPECGTKWDEKKHCPKCGTEVSDTARFCPVCGYVLYKTNTKPSRFTMFKIWIKLHKMLAFCLAVIIIAAIISACCIPVILAKRINGKYLWVYGGEVHESSYFILNSGKWEDNYGAFGTYEKDGDKLLFYIFGNVGVNSGTLIDYELKLNGYVYIHEDHIEEYMKKKSTKFSSVLAISEDDGAECKALRAVLSCHLEFLPCH